AAHGAGGVAPDGVVPAVSPPSRALRAAPGRRLRRRLRAPRGSARAGRPARQGVRHPDPHELLHLPPMTRDASDGVRAVPVALKGVRRRLEGVHGRAYWKSLEELAGDPAVEEMLRREFPEQASMFDDPLGRRQFLTLMGASLALAGLTACTRQPEEKVVPYVKPPEGVVPGRPLFFATAVLDGGYAKGVLVESHLGRPTKIEGNPDHPISLGATDARGQAAILDLYDPDRLPTLMSLGQILPWGSFLASMKSALDAQRPAQGGGIRILTETVTSPTLAAQIKDFLTEFPAANWHQWEAAGRDAARAG